MTFPKIVRTIGKSVIKTIPLLRRQLLTSTDYSRLDGLEAARREASFMGGWMARRTVRRQEAAYESLLAAMKRGEPRIDFQIAAQAVKATQISHPRLLEVGCGSGYYSEVLGKLLGNTVRYVGIDYSEAMIARARICYPSNAFEIGDATQLPFEDGAFEIVFNGVSLLHILDYQQALCEAARVASDYCILHTVPVHAGRTTFLKKFAYGAPVIEIIFEKKEIMSICAELGLELEREWTSIDYDLAEITGHRSTTETYLFSKRKA